MGGGASKNRNTTNEDENEEDPEEEEDETSKVQKEEANGQPRARPSFIQTQVLPESQPKDGQPEVVTEKPVIEGPRQEKRGS